MCWSRRTMARGTGDDIRVAQKVTLEQQIKYNESILKRGKGTQKKIKEHSKERQQNGKDREKARKKIQLV